MRYAHPCLVAISAYALLATPVAGTPKHKMSKREFKNFNYPTRAETFSLGQYEVDLGYEIHKGIESVRSH
jgi:hypothetical protein